MSRMPGDEVSILSRRGIEAQMLRNVHDVITVRSGKAEADAVINEAVSEAAIAQGRQLAETVGHTPTLKDLQSVLALWTREDALSMDIIESTPERLSFNVTRCRYAEMYRQMGLGHLGHLFSCNRDGDFCIGFNPAIVFERTQTIMDGAPYCDFRYRMVSGKREDKPVSETGSKS